ncbi:hypothetical protein OG905_01470 [Streptomyces sp. NBC_00322]|uniref:hypothetical protein n=1 Tax=Streptomyces sp. NBC_00322 TaxID=2975712 RepID=UPI002E2B7BF2|nr:hypothetical protein [Streptomyces sp. NBC_00322]
MGKAQVDRSASVEPPGLLPLSAQEGQGEVESFDLTLPALGTDHDIVFQALKDAGVHDAFAEVLDPASASVVNGVGRGHGLGGGVEVRRVGEGDQVRDAFRARRVTSRASSSWLIGRFRTSMITFGCMVRFLLLSAIARPVRR